MRLDPTRAHTKTIKGVDGPKKTFNTKEGERQKFDILFSDGYEAEFCPLVHEVTQIPRIGQTVTFSVKHSGRYGDEIEIVPSGREDGMSVAPGKNQGPIVSMGGHPATIALRAAVDVAAICAKDGVVVMDDLFSEADRIYEWLIRKADGQ